MTKNLDKLKIDIIRNFISKDRPFAGVIIKRKWLKIISQLSESEILETNSSTKCSSYDTPDKIQKSKSISSASTSELKNTLLIRRQNYPFLKSKNNNFKRHNIVQKTKYTTNNNNHRKIIYKKPVQEQVAINIERNTRHPNNLEPSTLDISLYNFLTTLDEAHLKLIQSLDG